MAKKTILKRGFKTQAERFAKQYRQELKIHPCDALCAFKLAEYLQVPVYSATKFFTLPDQIQWLSKNCEWSALTMPNSEGTTIILHNPFHSDARQQSDLMHEMAHIICEHSHPEVDLDHPIPFGMRNYNQEQEEEAKCLGSTLQLATPCLLWAKKRSMTTEQIAEHYNASKDMVLFRMKMTGIAKIPKSSNIA